jgi:putative ABC transport system permease protein
LHEVEFSAATLALVLACAVLLGAGVGATGLTHAGMERLFDRLRSGRATASRAWKRAQSGMVTLQIAMALSLLVAAALLGRSFWNLRNADLGFQPAGALTFQVSLPWNGYGSYAEGAAFHAKVMDRLSALPGVTEAEAALGLPLGGTNALRLDAVGETGRPVVAANGNLATSDYFRVMGIPLRGGRSFAPGDLRGATPAVVISERLATSLFGTTDAVGRFIRRPGRTGTTGRTYRVIGVVGDVHGERIEDGYVPMAYFPLLRDGDGVPKDSFPVPYAPRWVQYVVRASQPPSPQTIQALISSIDRAVPAVRVEPLEAIVDRATARVRLTMLLIAVAGGAALLLGVIGVYSVVSYAAAGRVREFGVRLALGAAPSHIGRMVIGDGLVLVALGTVVGLTAALAATRFLRSLLYDVTPTHAAEFALATLVLVVVSLAATLFPARRAARTNPAVVLRGE